MKDPFLAAIQEVSDTASEEQTLESMISFFIGKLAMKQGYGKAEKTVLGYLDAYKEMLDPGDV